MESLEFGGKFLGTKHSLAVVYLNSLVNHFICCCSISSYELTPAFRASTWRRAIHADRARKRKYANPCKRSRENTRSCPDRIYRSPLCLAKLLQQGCRKQRSKTTMALVFLEEQ